MSGRTREGTALETRAIIMEEPKRIGVQSIGLQAPVDGDVVVDVLWSGVSTGTERLLWSGKMPWFPGLEYPLVPGYESVGVVSDVVGASSLTVGDPVFVPGSNKFVGARGLFGANAAQLVLPSERVVPLAGGAERDAVNLALAATAQHALAPTPTEGAVLVVGHGVVGRLLARLLVARGDGPVTVWETNPGRWDGAEGYAVAAPPASDARPETQFETIYDASGDASVLDLLVAHIAPRGEVVLAGFYADRVSFSFPPAFMREARLRVAAEWRAEDMSVVQARIADGTLSLAGLVSHNASARDAESAYHMAFTEAACTKLVLDWRDGA